MVVVCLPWTPAAAAILSSSHHHHHHVPAGLALSHFRLWEIFNLVKIALF